MAKKCEILLLEGAIGKSKAKRSYYTADFGRGLQALQVALLLALGGCGGIPPTKEARSTKLDPPLHANVVHSTVLCWCNCTFGLLCKNLDGTGIDSHVGSSY